jgi:hypothetical protein
MSKRQTRKLTERVRDDSPGPEDRGRNQVTVLSSAVLSWARTGGGESRARFALRAGVDLAVVEAAEDGTGPAWGLSYAEFTALAEAVSMLNPLLRDVFETAAACDLLVTCVMRGELAFSTEVLADDGTRDLAVGLLRWAFTGQFRLPGYETCVQLPVTWAWHDECGGWICPACGWCPCETGPEGCGHRGQLLGDVDLIVLRARATALAASSSPDAWVGAELLAVLGSAR